VPCSYLCPLIVSLFVCAFFHTTAIPSATAQEKDYSKSLPPLSPRSTRSGGYHVSLLINKGNKTELGTIVVDWLNDEVFSLSFDSGQLPRSCIVSDEVLNFEEPGSGPVPIVFDLKVLDTVVFPRYFSKKGGAEEESDYSLPLPAVIEGSAKAKTTLDRTYVQELIVCESGGFFVSYRMPVESRFFAYPVRSCFVYENKGARQWYTNINGSGVSFARVQHPGKQGIKGLTKEGCRSLFFVNQFKPWADTYSELMCRMVASSNETSAKTLSADKAHERERLFYQLMRLIRNEFDLLLTDGNSLFLDPFTRGMMLEQALWRPDRHPATTTQLLSLVLSDLESSSGELSLSYSLFCAYADLGFAPNETSHALFFESAQGQAFRVRDSAAVLARWRWPTAQRHVDATVEFIQTAKHMTDKLNCVETLILMEEFDSIPPDLMERWFAKINGDAAQIRRPLNLLMQNPSGRRYLADKYKAMPVDAPLREPIQALFANELSAVHHFGDYRFWTKEECKRLESDLQLETADATKP